jgi:glycosyltransferase involved in cell wall biosynthesis
LDIGAWRGAFGRLLRGAERVFAPSRDVARRIARYFPDVSATVLAHPEVSTVAMPRITRVVTLGNLTPEKGLRVVAACAEDARARNLPLSFRVLGSTTEPVPLWPQTQLSIHGQYEDGELPKILGAERPDVIWFPAQVPETYSYTLSVALAAGVPIVAAALGVFPERLAGHSDAILVPWDANPGAWNDVLLRAGPGNRAQLPSPASEKLTIS